MMKRVLMVLVFAVSACEFDESGLEGANRPAPSVDGGQSAPESQPAAQVEQEQRALDTTGLPPRLPVGAFLCGSPGVQPPGQPPPYSAHVWVWANGYAWCVQMGLRSMPDLNPGLGWDNRITQAIAGACADIILWEHPNYTGAVNLIPWWGAVLDSWWRVRVSSLQIRPLPC